MHDYLGRVGLDGDRRRLRAEDVGQVGARLEGRDGRVEGGAGELVAAANDADPAVVTLAAGGGQVGHDAADALDQG